MEKQYFHTAGRHNQAERYSKAATLRESESVRQPSGSSPGAVSFELKLFIG